MKTMQFTDLTNALIYVTPGDPYSEAMRKREVKTLPPLSHPGATFMELNGIPMILLFGGYDVGDVDGPSSALIAINREYKEWYYVEFEHTHFPPPAPRINPVLVGFNGRLYIFSGITNFGDDWVYHRTYSIVDFQLGCHTHKCKWVAVDTPYPDDIPVVFDDGFPDIDFEKDNIVYYHTKTGLFTQAKVDGTLPHGLPWYCAGTLDPSLILPARSSSLPGPSASPEFWILLCTWQRYGPDNDLAPELWVYRLTSEPSDKMLCIDVVGRVHGLGKNLLHFCVVGDRAFLLGSSEDSDAEEMIMLETCIEIPIPRLLKDALTV